MLKLYYNSGREYLGHTNLLLLSPKSYGRDFPPSCRPSLFLVRAAAAAGGQQKSCFKSAENRAASSLGYGYNGIRCLRIYFKSQWV